MLLTLTFCVQVYRGYGEWTQADHEHFHIVDSATETEDKDPTVETLPAIVSGVTVYSIPASFWGRTRADYDIADVALLGTSNDPWEGRRFPWIYEENGNVT